MTTLPPQSPAPRPRFRFARVSALATTAASMFIIAAIALPAGSVAGIPVKAPLFVFALGMFAVDVLTLGRLNLAGARTAWTGCLALTAVFAWADVGMLRGTSEWRVAQMALSSFATTVVVATLIATLSASGRIGRERLVRLVVGAAVTFAVVKVLLASAILLGVPFKTVDRFVVEVLNYNMVSMLIVPGVVRMHFVNDIFAVFGSLLVLLAPRLSVRLRRRTTAGALILLGMSVFLAYSRFLLVALVAMYAIWFFTTGRRRISRILLGATAALAVLAIVVSLDTLRTSIGDRFVSDAVIASDAVRTDQAGMLVAEWVRYPLVGKGIGGYVEHFVRSGSHPFSYELQWLSILLQTGVLGTILILSLLTVIGYRLLVRLPQGLGLGVVGAYLVWIGSGLTNPYLLSSAAGVMFGLFAAMGSRTFTSVGEPALSAQPEHRR